MAPPAWNAGFSRHSGPQGRGWFFVSLGVVACAAEPSRRMRSVPPPACGGLCRLKPAFQAVGAIWCWWRCVVRPPAAGCAGLKTGGPSRGCDLVFVAVCCPRAFGPLCRLKPAFQAVGAIWG